MNELSRRDVLATAVAAGLSAVPLNMSAAGEGANGGIFRLSVRGDDGTTVFIPEVNGKLVDVPYPTNNAGKLARTSDLEDVFKERVKRLTADEPLVVMVHGFMFDPGDDPLDKDTGNPHAAIFHFSNEKRKHFLHNFSWPLGLGFEQNGGKGLAVAFGWNSNPKEFADGMMLASVLADLPDLIKKSGLKFTDGVKITKLLNEVRKIKLADLAEDRGREKIEALFQGLEEPLKKIAVHQSFYTTLFKDGAPKAAGVLKDVILNLAKNTEKPIHLFAHSLGTRVVLQALKELTNAAAGAALLKKKQVGKVILIGGAERSANARQVVEAVAAADGKTQFYNFTTRRDRVLEIFGERDYEEKTDAVKSVIGLRGLEKNAPSWIDLELDRNENGEQPDFIKWLVMKDRQKYEKVRGVHAFGILNHWHCFTNEDNLRLYRDILRDTGAEWSVETIRAALARM